MIEESQIDWGGHSNDAEYIKGEMESLSDLVEMCLNYQREHPNVLLVLTADHECGGVAVDLDGRTEIDGLFAAGEVAFTGLHGPNRLASNTLLEASVLAERAVAIAPQPAE